MHNKTLAKSGTLRYEMSVLNFNIFSYITQSLNPQEGNINRTPKTAVLREMKIII
jgi:hypothetical protein